MAKTSAVQKNLKRIRLVKKYAKKRAALKKIINNRKLELSERFEAQLKLNKLPKNWINILNFNTFRNFKNEYLNVSIFLFFNTRICENHFNL